ncbi:LacI family DNA-binding transcriptional regulator (plasmid) [Arthrobacter sp. G.S.26]|uniref:LacI family DNA-binding transcriptional regulator n=1 Tax=Arthrobacter sp. G.S.26 TaxID=3433706 RepID=UPI003D772DC0
MSGTKGTGGRRITIVDVARHAGVSTASASKVLRNAYGASQSMRDKVQASIETLGYRPYAPARGMRGRTFTIGVVLSDLDNPFFSLIIEGLSRAVRSRSYELFISPSGYEGSPQQMGIEAMIDHQVDGLVLVAPLVTPAHLEVIATQIPLLVIGNHSRSQVFDSVAADDHRGAQLAVDHLVTLQHRRIAYVMRAGDLSDETRPESRRLTGFKHAMQKHGLSSDSMVLFASWNLEGGREAARHVDSLASPPTAVFAGADVVALGMINDLWDRGLSVPRTYSLVGYDNSRSASLGPISLTSVDQSGVRMGERAGELLIERIEGRNRASHETFEPRMVKRNSTAAPAQLIKYELTPATKL